MYIYEKWLIAQEYARLLRSRYYKALFILNFGVDTHSESFKPIAKRRVEHSIILREGYTFNK